MNQSAPSSSYVIQPPSFPDVVFKMSTKPYLELMEWAKTEFNARLDYCAKHGYMREHRELTRNFSPVRILAELTSYRRFCSIMSERIWNEFRREERRFFVDAFELREFLMRTASGRHND